MKIAEWCRVFSLAAGTCLVGAPLSLAKPQTSLEDFNISQEPAKADWRFFIKAPEASREKLWAYHAARGKHLGDWAWGWRLGWVRVCGQSMQPLCGDILRQALFDKALVVRAEAASRLGQLYEGTASEPVASLLGQAYRNGRNLRHGKPLFVQERILYALKQIGGDKALAQAEALAASHAASRAYWARLAKVAD